MKDICPICQKKWKILKQCYYCKTWHCSECNVKGICLDCYSILNAKQEVRDYFKEKYAVMA